MTKPWDPDVQLGVFADETQSSLMAEVFGMVKPFFKRAGSEEFCDRMIAEFKELEADLAAANAEDAKNRPEPEPEPELDPEDHHSPGPGDFTHGCCGTVPVSIGELLMVEMAFKFLTKEQEKYLREKGNDGLSDVEEFVSQDTLMLFDEKPDDADFKDSEKFWALCDVYDEEHPEKVEERERANKEFLEDQAWWDRCLRGEESTPEEVEEEDDEDEY